MGFENGPLPKETRQDKSADSPEEVRVIIILNDDLIKWHRFQRGDDGITSVKSTEKHKIDLLSPCYKSHGVPSGDSHISEQAIKKSLPRGERGLV